MATYTTILGLTKQATNENRNTWGTVLNNGVIELTESAIAGETAIALAGDVTLSTTQGAANQARAAILRISSSDAHDRVITVPAASKLYTLVNDSDKRVKIKPSGGTATDVMPATEADIRVTSAKAVRRSVSGWGLHSTNATTSGSSVTFTLTGLGQHFNDIMLVFTGVSLNAAGSITFQPRNDAGSGGTAVTAYSLLNGANLLWGTLRIPGYRIAVSSGSVEITEQSAFASPNVAVAATHNTVISNVTGGIGSIVIGTGATFDAGSIDLYLG